MKVALKVALKFLEVKILIKWGTIIDFNLTLPWLLRITNKLSGEKIVYGNWPQGDNGELRISIIDY